MEAVAKNAATIEQLKERIRKLQAAPRRYLAALRTGVGPLDALLPAGGIPLGQAVELWGEAAAGRTSLALRVVAAAHRENRIAAWVDGPSELYPPSAAALGVDLGRLLIVRPKAPRQLVWAAQQLARSGAFACVVVDLTHTGVRPSLGSTCATGRSPPLATTATSGWTSSASGTATSSTRAAGGRSRTISLR